MTNTERTIEELKQAHAQALSDVGGKGYYQGEMLSEAEIERLLRRALEWAAWKACQEVVFTASEAAVEIENLDSPQNPVAQRLRKALHRERVAFDRDYHGIPGLMAEQENRDGEPK